MRGSSRCSSAVHQARARLVLGRQRQHGDRGGTGADLGDRLRRAAMHAQRRQRAEMLARQLRSSRAGVGLAHRDDEAALHRRGAASSSRQMRTSVGGGSGPRWRASRRRMIDASRPGRNATPPCRQRATSLDHPGALASAGRAARRRCRRARPAARQAAGHASRPAAAGSRGAGGIGRAGAGWTSMLSGAGHVPRAGRLGADAAGLQNPWPAPLH